MTTSVDDKVSRKAMTGYGVGDFGFNLYWTGLSIYLLIYYTDVLKIDPATAGLIFSLSILWDAITDPIMGIIATRTRTRWGKFRPYILFGAPFMGAAFVMMFAAPILFPSRIVIASAAAHILFRTMFTVVSIPYSSLTSVLTPNSDERTKLSGARMLGAVIGALFATVMMPSLAQQFGGDNLKLGWALVAVLFSGIATALLIVVFVTTEERPETYVGRRRPTLSESLQFVLSNHALWIVFAGILLTSAAMSIGNKTIVYFIKYNLDAESETGMLLGAQALTAAISIPFWVRFATRTSKRTAWLTGVLGIAAIQLSLYFFTPETSRQILPIFFLNGVGLGSLALMFWSTVPDTVEFGEWKSGVRDDGLAFSLCTFGQKTGVAIGVGLLGYHLSLIGYVPDTSQTERALNGLRTAAFLYPAGLALTAAAVIAFYPITGERHKRILDELSNRQSVGTSSTSKAIS
ncbi:MAG: glycoside-pentoside-hexuronide (GPH):cation symporter [Pseudomonadota bacterium]